MQNQSRPYAQVKDIDSKGRTVQFYGSAFGVLDSDDDIVVKGAFSKSIQENGPQSARPRIQHLLQHNSYAIIGKMTELTEDENGLLCTSILADNADGKDALALYELNVLEHSIGFNTIKQEFDNSTGVRRLTELKLWEVSAVTWGANEYTPLVALKGLNPAGKAEALAERSARLLKALRTGNMQDSTYQALEAEWESIQSAYKELITLPAEEKPAPAPVVEVTSEEQMEPVGADLVGLFSKSLTFLS